MFDGSIAKMIKMIVPSQLFCLRFFDPGRSSMSGSSSTIADCGIDSVLFSLTEGDELKEMLHCQNKKQVWIVVNNCQPPMSPSYYV